MMSTRTVISDFFVAGGTLHPQSPSYVERPADNELFNLALTGKFCYVLTPRQMGKSSLMIRTARRLQAAGIHTAIIDLTTMGVNAADTWYLYLLTELADELDLSVDPEAWWQARASLGQVRRFVNFLRDVVLTEITDRVVIFIDEIDTTLSLDFSDDFFAAIRAMYNARAKNPVFNRLTFVLIGVAMPSDLVKDQTRTPFNIGQAIDLQELGRADLQMLQAGWSEIESDQRGAILERIFYWTDGHPYLTQKLCLAVAESKDERWTDERIDELVESLFLSEETRKESNLKFVRDRILTYPQSRQLLALYRQVHKGKSIGDDERSLVQSQLKLSGLVKAENGVLRVRNEIYRRVFDLAWVREHTAINWAPIVAGVMGFVALLAIGFILFEFSVGIRLQGYVANFHEATNAPEEQLSNLASVFRLWSFLGSRDYDYKARELFFYGLSREEQLALFNNIDVHDVADSDLIDVISGLYVTLADVDGAGSTTPILEAMVRALDHLDETEEITHLSGEINGWLRGRDLARQSQYNDALVEYDKAIELNGENPATRYERAKVLIELLEYQRALSDLDQVVAIAREAPTPMPTPSPTVTPITPSVAWTTTSTSTPTVPIRTPTSSSTETPTPNVTVIPTPRPVSTETPMPTLTPVPASIRSEFATTGQMINAVRNLIYGDPQLTSFLANVSNSEYPNLREFGLVPTLTPGGESMIDVADFLPEHWQYIKTCRLDTNGDGMEEWVVLYRFDISAETEQPGGSVGAAVYQLDDSNPPVLISYTLTTLDGSYLCECKCTPTMEDVLSGLGGDELVVRDDCDGEITRLAIFYWDPSAEKYLPKGHFSGDRITSSPNEVTVDRRLPDRAQLAIRQTCYPDEENKTYYWLEGQDTVIYEKYESIFYDGEPEDVMLSPYPEKVVLAFYNHYTGSEKDVSAYFTEGGWERVDKCAAGNCGCIAARSDIEHVRVIYLLPGEETHNQTTVEAIVTCEHKDENQGDDQQQILEWRLVREDDRWKLDNVDVKQTQTGESEGGEQ